MANVTAKDFKNKIQKYMEVNFGTDLKNGSKRQVYQAVLGATNEVLAEKRYKFNKKVEETEAKQVYYMSY